MKFMELKNALAGGKTEAAYCVCGADRYLCAKALSALLARVTAFPELNVCYLPETAGGGAIAEAAETLPLGDSPRAVVVREWGCGGADALASYLKSPAPGSFIIFYYPGGARPAALKGAETVDCAKLDAHTVIKWINANADIEREAAASLAERCSLDMTRISTEVAKLKSYKKDGALSLSDIEDTVAPDADYRIYRLADAAARGEAAFAFKAARDFSADKTPPVALIAGMYSHFRRLLYCAVLRGSGKSADEIARLLGVKPYAVSMASAQSAVFTPRRLKEITDNLREYELSVKSGKMDGDAALTLALGRIISARKNSSRGASEDV